MSFTISILVIWERKYCKNGIAFLRSVFNHSLVSIVSHAMIGLPGPLMAQSAASAESKFLSLGGESYQRLTEAVHPKWHKAQMPE
ncbi:MAG: hypothetical protein GY753_03435 [Gammaproteobacteria bacterium]|nr:hypothetical protein [Gammaproteobacteria bacterium]